MTLDPIGDPSIVAGEVVERLRVQSQVDSGMNAITKHIPVMDDAKAHQIFGQTVAGDAGKLCRFEEGGEIFARLDAVRNAMRNAASWVAEELAGFCGVFPNRGLIRRLDLGQATPPEQLEAAMALRLMNAPDPTFKGLRITMESRLDGTVSMHTQGFNMLGTDTQRLLDAALSSLTEEIEDFRRCPFHRSPPHRTHPADLSTGPGKGEG